MIKKNNSLKTLTAKLQNNQKELFKHSFQELNVPIMRRENFFFRMNLHWETKNVIRVFLKFVIFCEDFGKNHASIDSEWWRRVACQCLQDLAENGKLFKKVMFRIIKGLPFENHVLLIKNFQTRRAEDPLWSQSTLKGTNPSRWRWRATRVQWTSGTRHVGPSPGRNWTRMVRMW